MGELPTWLLSSVSEFHTGKIEGVVKEGRYLLQRPSGAIPERLALTPDFLLPPKARARKTGVAAILGLAIACVMGTVNHAFFWISGETFTFGKFAWSSLAGWIMLTG